MFKKILDFFNLYKKGYNMALKDIEKFLTTPHNKNYTRFDLDSNNPADATIEGMILEGKRIKGWIEYYKKHEH